ncbi:MAG: c-type cytochrome, partial [Verrucomicrobiae bacterium]|nr:c-type cytochrome [Verrucomicrobiae bacterium]
FSQVETPWGVSRGDTAGFWRFDPRVTRLDPFGFPSMVSQNPCGVALDRWGALFVKSNGPHLCFATPGLIATTHPRELMQFAQVGQTPGKSMGGDIVESAHLPDWIQNHAVIAGYFAREISAIPLVEDAAGYAVSQPIQLVYGGHESFRPVDIRQGPDGAIYISDWFNPVINHYQVSLRHPDRDYSHGRIWRLSAKGRPLVTPPNLATSSIDQWVGYLGSDEPWPRLQARRLLRDHGNSEMVREALRKRLKELKPDENIALVEIAGVLESLGDVTGEVLDQLQNSPEPMARAAAGRILARLMAPVADGKTRLSKLLRDPHPRPRLEAVVACASLKEPEALKMALTALDAGPDRFIEYSLGQAVFALEEWWLPALQSGSLKFETPSHLAFVLETLGNGVAADLARKAMDDSLSKADRQRLLLVLAKLGTPADLSQVFEEAAESGSEGLLVALVEAAESRRARPEPLREEELRALIRNGDGATRLTAAKLAGLWKVASLEEVISALVGDETQETALRAVAAMSAARIQGKAAASFLLPLVESKAAPLALRRSAVEALAIADVTAAGQRIAAMALGTQGDPSSTELLSVFLTQNGGAAALAAALESEKSVDAAKAQEILTAMNRLGRTDPKLAPLLNRAIGRQSGAPEYAPKRVEVIVRAVRAGEGNPEKGAEVFRLAQLACMACHRIGDEGGVIGPSLNGVGAGLPLDQIVESILWPERQIKEGFQAVAFTTTSGSAITGYVEREGDDIVWYRNTTTPWILPLAKKDIASRENIPTLMPPGLTQSLTEEQLRDLVAYLASLKG